MNRLTIEIVSQAISEIRAKGEYPSFKAILKHVGYGSYSTLTKLKAKYPSVFKTPVATTLDTSNTTVIDTLNTATDTSNTTVIDTLNTQITTALNTHFAALEQRLEQRFEQRLAQFKNELLAELKKNDCTSETEVEKLKRQIEVLETQNQQLKAANEKLTQRVETLQAANERKEKLIEQGHDSFKGLSKEYESILSKNKQLEKQLELKHQQVEQLKADLERLNLTEQELKIALENVDKLAAENEALRSSLKPSKVATQIKTTESKSTVEQGHDRFIQLRHQYPNATQTELARILDNEGYKSSTGKSFSKSVINRWFHERID